MNIINVLGLFHIQRPIYKSEKNLVVNVRCHYYLRADSDFHFHPIIISTRFDDKSILGCHQKVFYATEFGNDIWREFKAMPVFGFPYNRSFLKRVGSLTENVIAFWINCKL